MKDEHGREEELFVCDCGDLEHQFVVSWYPEDEDWNDELYLNILLSQNYGFWKRLWIALKYLFGHRCCFGAFDAILINTYRAKRLRDILESFIEINEAKKCK